MDQRQPTIHLILIPFNPIPVCTHPINSIDPHVPPIAAGEALHTCQKPDQLTYISAHPSIHQCNHSDSCPPHPLQPSANPTHATTHLTPSTHPFPHLSQQRNVCYFMVPSLPNDDSS